jgi:HAD superfamily hydrolase (TIGR01509 family)
MKPDSRLKGIIFDMDGVLVDSEPFIREAASKMFEQTYHVQVQPDDFRPFVGTGEDRFIGGVAELYGIKLSMPRDKERTYEIYLEIIKHRLRPLPGAIDLVHQSRRRGLKLAVATSADHIKMVGNLHEMGLPPDDFDAIVTGNDVQRKKPDPQIFLLAAERLKLEPANCLVIEDAPNGIRAGKSAGGRCLGITSTFDAETLRTAGADWISPDLAHVPPEALA